MAKTKKFDTIKPTFKAIQIETKNGSIEYKIKGVENVRRKVYTTIRNDL